MEHAVTRVLIEQNGLRFCKTNNGRWIDQYGRIFHDKGGKIGKFYGCGYANH